MPCYFALDAYRLAIMHRYEPLKRYQRWWFYVLVLIGFSFAADYTVLLIRTAVAEMFVVPGRAMWPTIKHNDRIVVDKFWKDVSNVKRGDVVVVYREGPSSELVNLRVVALPGDTVEIKDEQLILNGLEVIERYAELKGDKPLYIPKLINQDPVTIPAGSFYVLGDNRRFALDSRLLGPIPFADFYGFPSVIYWSRDYEFHGADEYSEGTPGRIRWDRIGTRLD
jgi:signal peptidase I